MIWNYRVYRHVIVIDDTETEDYLAIHETYYDGSEDDNIVLVSTEAINPSGFDLAELTATLNQMLEATKKPILDAADYGLTLENNENLDKR